MATEDIDTSGGAEDIYPSRCGIKAALVERQDPVVYASSSEEGPIDRSLVKQYDRQGFLVLENVFSATEVAYLRRELNHLRNDERIKTSQEAITEPGGEDVRSIFKVHKISSVFAKLANDRRLAGLAQYLLNDRVYIHQSRVNYKPGFRGKEFYWHSDFETWHVEDGMPRMRAVSMSIALTENFECNGPLMLVPGSHRSYAICEGQTPDEHYKLSLKKQEYGIPADENLREMVQQGGIVTATGKPGSVIVFECNTMHGSNSNITPFPRSNVFFVYNALNNRVVDPFSGLAPRPEYICSRAEIEPIEPQSVKLSDEEVHE